MALGFFEITYLFLGLIVGSAIRVYYAKGTKNNKVKIDRKAGLERWILLLPFMGMIIFPLIFIFTSWLEFANYILPAYLGYFGIILFIVALWVLYRSHKDLGKNFFSTLRTREKHTLVTTGIYHRIRHPMYAAHIIWGVAQIFLLQNWIAGFSMIILLWGLYIYRVPREEKMMIDQFGSEYRDYIKRTGRIIPKF